MWLERGETIEKCPCLIQFVSYFETSVTINIFYIWLSPEVKIICHIDTREAEQLLLHNHQGPVDAVQLNLTDGSRSSIIPNETQHFSNGLKIIWGEVCEVFFNFQIYFSFTICICILFSEADDNI